MASKYQRDTGRKIALPGQLGDLFEDPSISGDNKMVRAEEEKFDEALKKGRIAAETLNKPMTFFEAVEALDLPKADPGDGKKTNRKKDNVIVFPKNPNHQIQSIDLSGFKFLRFSRAGL